MSRDTARIVERAPLPAAGGSDRHLMRVLLIAPDAATAKAALDGCLVHDVPTGEAALDSTQTSYDAIVIEMALPGIDGLGVLRRLRAARVTTPVVVLTAVSDMESKVQAFAAGADDYVLKPFEPRELVARLRAVVRRSAWARENRVRVGDVEIDLDAKRASAAGRALQLTVKEYGILELLSRRPDEVVPKARILGHLYVDRDDPRSRNIDYFVSRLRKKLHGASSRANVASSYGHGYVLRTDGNAASGRGAA